MADVTLSDGREITFDLNKISIKEYRALFNAEQSPEDESDSLARVSGLTPAEIEMLPYMDWRRFVVAFFKKARQPLDPNLASGFSSQSPEANPRPTN